MREDGEARQGQDDGERGVERLVTVAPTITRPMDKDEGSRRLRTSNPTPTSTCATPTKYIIQFGSCQPRDCSTSAGTALSPPTS